MILDIFAVLLAVLVLIGFRVAPRRGLFSENGLDRVQSVALRGILCILIMLDHSALLTQAGATAFFFKKAAYFVVGLFFALSGYGLTASWQRDQGSVKGFWLKRWKTMLLPYLLLSVLAAAVRLLIGEQLTLKQVLLSFINGKPLVRYSWFILVMIVLYVLFYLAALLAREDRALLLAIVGFGAFALPFVLRKLGFEEYWYNAVWTFPIGVLWFLAYRKIAAAFRRHPWILLGISGLCSAWLVMVAVYFCWFSYLGMLLATVFVTVFVFLLMMKLRFCNPILCFLGHISLEIYLIHGVVVTALLSGVSPAAQPVRFLLILFSATILLAWLFHSGYSLIAEKSKRA